ncbi:hypothetical protein IFM60648_01391 [Aspergillus lentulus]|uniref:Uncharacterized protein n=1 Tax=Aspergillus lentulus TaxID=293939 RepID=A0ABQ0ZU98_ASPLE|nr:hypothetical protein IFM60648_01391 [Aspergillus lentulus]
MSASKPTRGGPLSRQRNFYSPLDLPDQDDEEVLPDPQREEDDEQPPAQGNRYAHLALPQRAPENLPTPLLEGSVSPEKWTVKTNRRFHIPGGFESEEEGSLDDWGSSEDLEPDQHLVVRHSEPARDPRHKDQANPQSEVESLGKGVEHQSRSPLPPAPRPSSSLQATARSVTPKTPALPASEPSPGIGEQKEPSEDSPAKRVVERKDRVSGATFDREGDRDVVTTSARELLEEKSLVQPNRSDGRGQSGPSDAQLISQSRRGRSPYGVERTVSSALTDSRTSHQISGKELPQGYQQKAYNPPSHGMAKEPTSLEDTMQQQGRSGGRERRAGLERSITPSDRPEAGMEEPSPEEDALPLPGQACRPDRDRPPSRDARQQSIRKITELDENQSRVNRPAPPAAHDGVGGAPAINTPQPPAGDTKDRRSSQSDARRDSYTGFVSRPRSDKDPSGLNSRPPSTRPQEDQHSNVSQTTEHRRKHGPMQQDRERHGAPMPLESTPGPVDHAAGATASHPSRHDHGISSQRPSQPTVYPSESETSLPRDVKGSPSVNATRPSGRHPDTLPIRPPQSNAGLLTPQTGHNDRDRHTNTDSGSRPRGILGKPQQPQTASSAGKARMMSEDQSPPAPRQRAGHQDKPASQPPENMAAASDSDSHQKTTGSTSSRAATNDADSHDAGRQQPSPPLGGDKSAGNQSYPPHGGRQPQMPNAPVKKDPQDRRDPPSQKQQGHERGQGVQKPREDQQKSDSIPNNIPTTDPAETRPSAASKVGPRPKNPAPGAAGAGFNENHATTTPATKHRTKKDAQETVPPSQKGTPENTTSDTGRSIGDEQLQDPVSTDRPDPNHRGDFDSSAPGAGTEDTDYATVDADGKGYNLLEEDARLQVISEEIFSTILEGELSELLAKALGARRLSAFSILPTWRQDELCREAVEQATAELSEFVDAVVSAQTDS